MAEGMSGPEVYNTKEIVATHLLWKQKDGTLIWTHDMDDRHMINSMLMILRHEAYDPEFGLYLGAWRLLLTTRGWKIPEKLYRTTPTRYYQVSYENKKMTLIRTGGLTDEP